MLESCTKLDRQDGVHKTQSLYIIYGDYVELRPLTSKLTPFYRKRRFLGTKCTIGRVCGLRFNATAEGY